MRLPNSGPAAWENIKTVAVRGKIVDFCGKWCYNNPYFEYKCIPAAVNDLVPP